VWAGENLSRTNPAQVSKGHRIGPPHHSYVAALIYQNSSRVADEAIAAALDARLTERKSRVAPNVVGPVEGLTEPQLIAN
jgi:hypothetical protein